MQSILQYEYIQKLQIKMYITCTAHEKFQFPKSILCNRPKGRRNIQRPKKVLIETVKIRVI